ncbi:uncharacterized protein LOC123699889 [Colias croceus]|uniref:uncharacterized protein LOC123699889 n=1 Tax=Colias crocea TaxID=72248 RepID=UPI001E27D29B|nr:uncharacterized protein LOC123699889 [Colias croceus]
MNIYNLAWFFVFLIRISKSKRYDNYSLFNVVPMERYQLKFLQNLESQKYMDVMFWRRPYKMFSDVQILVNPVDLALFKERLVHFGMSSRLLSSNIQKQFDQQFVRRYMRLRVESYTWDYYHSLEDIYQWMADMAARYPKIVKLKAIGKSAEGREILAISISRPKNKAKVIVEGALHGNEWITTEFITYLANELITADRSRNAKLKRVANRFHWLLIPVANPDGYDYSMKVDRLWRNNRNIQPNNTAGVDLNRNFDYNFCSQGGSKEPNNDFYCGPNYFSEPESRALADFVGLHRKDLNFYFSFHAYGQKFLIPYSDRVRHVENFSEMENYGKQAILKMYKLNGVKYGVGTIYDTLGYRISGDSASWVKKNHKVKYVITFLLRDNGTFGYALPSDQIQATCKETLTGLLEIMTARHRRVSPVLFILFVYTLANSLKKYKNYSLIRGIPVEEAHLDFFKNLSEMYDVNYWRMPGQVYRPIEFIISPKHRHDFLRKAKLKGVYFATIMDDVQRALEMQTVKSYIRRNMDSFDWRSFFRLDDIYEWLADLETQYPKIMQVFSIGKSVQNRKILAVRIAHKGCSTRPKVIVEGGIHAREWIAPAFVTYFIHQILTAPEQNGTLRTVAFMYQWYFVPVLNPDGYDYTHTTDRMHRKNMNHVDLNRNFGIAFGTVGVSSNKLSETYCGPNAFSEPESQAMGNFVSANSKNLKYYLAFHAYGQYLIIPYTHSSKHTDNFDVVRDIGLKAAKQIETKFGTQYTVGTAYDTVGYMTSGVSGCWVKKSFAVPYVLTFELRDEGQHGFALPPQQILPTCQETMDGVLSILSQKKDTNLEKLFRDTSTPGIKAGQGTVFDGFVIFWNCFLFVIIRF